MVGLIWATIRRRTGRYGWAAASAASEPWTTTSTSPGIVANASGEAFARAFEQLQHAGDVVVVDELVSRGEMR